MIIFWIIVYLVIMALSIVALCVAKSLNVRPGYYGFDPEYWAAPIVSSIFWPIGLPVYGAYLTARWAINNQDSWRKK